MIEVKNLNKKYKNAVLKNLCLTADRGECIGIFGANGCGKTTLLEILSGSRKPDSGEISVFGKNPLKNKAVFSAYIGYVPQENPLIYDLSVKDNIRLWFDGNRSEFNTLFEKGIVSHMGLKEIKNKRVDKISGGMKRRLSIALALLKSPPVLLLDEPAAALDLKVKADIRNILKTYVKSGGTVIMTTHDEGDLSLFTRVMLMKDGKLKELDSEISGSEIIKQL
ncbi:MAG: ATP-binding cassette domain-containing protein [Clostridiales bacterium]|nr:ATP-binding cassette domain-containing protein [Clostridiales bacterium]